MAIAFVLYAGMIPVVPLIGYNIFKSRKERGKQKLCMGLFIGQLLLSCFCIYAYLH